MEESGGEGMGGMRRGGSQFVVSGRACRTLCCCEGRVAGAFTTSPAVAAAVAAAAAAAAAVRAGERSHPRREGEREGERDDYGKGERERSSGK